MILSSHQAPSSPGSSKKGKDGASVFKKMKLNSGKPLDTKPSKSAKEDFDPLENEQVKPSSSEAKPVTPKNETPSKFWQFVEPYCAPIGQEEVKFLEDLLKGYSDMSEYYRVPPLGQHYAIRWAKEDIETEKSKGDTNTNSLFCLVYDLCLQLETRTKTRRRRLGRWPRKTKGRARLPLES